MIEQKLSFDCKLTIFSDSLFFFLSVKSIPNFQHQQAVKALTSTGNNFNNFMIIMVLAVDMVPATCKLLLLNFYFIFWQWITIFFLSPIINCYLNELKGEYIIQSYYWQYCLILRNLWGNWEISHQTMHSTELNLFW